MIHCVSLVVIVVVIIIIIIIFILLNLIISSKVTVMVKGNDKRSKAAVSASTTTSLKNKSSSSSSSSSSTEVVSSNSTTTNDYYNEVLELKKTCPLWDSGNFFSSNVNHDDRMTEWLRIRILGKVLLDKYSWAIPDTRSLNILSTFSPLIEIGAGKGYWCSLLRNMNVDVVAYDNDKDNNETFTTVLLGDEKVLKQKSNKNRNLFLCYPDENYELALKCMQYYEGQYIIHVGELFFGNKAKSSAQSPWGRSTTSDFQVLLMEEFHCVLIADCKLRFPFTSDTISVWKRTDWVEGLIESDNDNDDDNDDDNDNDNLWASIEKEDVLPVDRSIVSLTHLL